MVNPALLLLCDGFASAKLFRIFLYVPQFALRRNGKTLDFGFRDPGFECRPSQLDLPKEIDRHRLVAQFAGNAQCALASPLFDPNLCWGARPRLRNSKKRVPSVRTSEGNFSPGRGRFYRLGVFAGFESRGVGR